MHELEKKHTGIREKLEHLFHLDYGDPKPSALSKSIDEQLQSKEIPGTESPKDASDNTRQNDKPWRLPRVSKHVWLAFGLGVSVPLVCSTLGAMFSPPPAPYIGIGTSSAAVESIPSAPSNVSAASNPSTPTAGITGEAGLSATHSTLSGVVDPRTLSASYYWSMTLANSSDSRTDKEAKMEIRLPEGAVVSRATLWIDGHPQEAAFNSTAAVEHGYNWITVQHRDPLLVTQQADGHIIVRMSPVPRDKKEARLQIGITAPVAVKNANTLKFPMPKMLASNFTVEKQDVHVESPVQIFANSAKFKNSGTAGHFIFKGNVSNAELNNLQLQAARPKDLPVQFATRATHSDAGTYILASLRDEEGAEAPKLILEKTLSKPECDIVKSEAAAHRIASLWAGQEISRIYKEDRNTAVSLGTAYRVVSPVTGATVLETENDYKLNNLHRNRYQTISYASAAEPSNAPLASFSATASTRATGPDSFDSTSAQVSDATTVSGVNTAGTVRINNLANMEAMLNLLSNGLEVFGIAWGGPTMIMGFMGMAGNSQAAMKRVLWGAASCAGGLSVPGCINWLVASSRDVNLFS